jgi:hypothetical protein
MYETITNSQNSNQVDLRILREMGIDVDRRKYEKPLRPIQKFRASVFTIMAAIRMSNMERQWREVKLVGEELKMVRSRQVRERQVSEKTNVKTTVRARSVREV